MVKCNNFDSNLHNCPCTYSYCSRKGRCCECISYHRKRDELPGCYFPLEIEMTYDRSISGFIKLYK